MTFRKFCKENQTREDISYCNTKESVTVGDKDGMFMTTDAIGFYE